MKRITKAQKWFSEVFAMMTWTEKDTTRLLASIVSGVIGALIGMLYFGAI